MVETETIQSVTRSEDEGEVRNDPGNCKAENATEIVEEKKEDELRAKRKAEAKKGISITRALLKFGFHSWIELEPVQMRNNDQYIEHALKSKLYAELEYIKEKRKIEEEAKLVLGNEYSKKIQEITDARNHAYLSDSDDDCSGPTKNVSQLGMLSAVCLDSVYMNYLQQKAKNPSKKEEESKKKKKSKRRGSMKPSPSMPLPGSSVSLRRHSSPKVVVTDTTPDSKDDSDIRNLNRRSGGRRGSLHPGKVSRRASGDGLFLEGIQEDKISDEGANSNSLPSPGRSQRSLKEEYSEKTQLKTSNNTPEHKKKSNVIPDAEAKEDDLLLYLITKNVKESEYSPEESVLYAARALLWGEYQRRKKQRQKLGNLLRRNAKHLVGILSNSKAAESSLARMARGNDLQNQKKAARRETRRRHSYAEVTDSNRI